MRKRLESFIHAFNGIFLLVSKEKNAIIQFIIAPTTIIAGIFFRIDQSEWIVIIFSVSLVLAMEAINTAIEKLADLVCQEKHPQIKKIKDLAAGAVLLCSIGAFIIGLLIFIPKLINM